VGAQGRGGWGPQPLSKRPFWCWDPGSLWLQRENSQLAPSERSGKGSTCPASCQGRFINGVMLKTQLFVKDRRCWALRGHCSARGQGARLVLRLLCIATAEPGSRAQGPVLGKGFFGERSAVPNRGSCSPSALRGQNDGVTAFGLQGGQERSLPQGLPAVRAPGREAAPADPSAMPGARMGRNSSYRAISGQVQRQNGRRSWNFRNHRDFSAAETILDPQFRHPDLSLDKPWGDLCKPGQVGRVEAAALAPVPPAPRSHS